LLLVYTDNDYCSFPDVAKTEGERAFLNSFFLLTSFALMQKKQKIKDCKLG